METLLAPLAIFQQIPLLAALVALLLLITLLDKTQREQARPTRLVAVSSFCWAAYGVWEYRVLVWSETVIAPIRVDLLVIYPLLALLTVWALLAIWRWRKTPERGVS